LKTTPLGNTGENVSALCLGAMLFGTRDDAALSFALLDQYVEAGGTFIDTANIYAHWIPGGRGGESETLLGQWMHERRNRSSLFIADKVGFDLPGVEPGLRAEQIVAECEKSLVRLGVETIDLYYAHVDDRTTPMEETLQAFDQLVRAGKVRYIGASNFPSWRLEEARWTSAKHGWAEYCCVQQRYSYLRPTPGAGFGGQIAANDDLIDYCRTRQIPLLAYSPLLGGTYTRPDRPLPPQYVGPDTDARLAVLRTVASEHKATAHQIVLSWMLSANPPVIPVLGVGSEQQLRENLDALTISLPPEEMALLDVTDGAPA
jgi:aryl-alcohol dehydrogenase-like predicted oxidoreductase